MLLDRRYIVKQFSEVHIYLDTGTIFIILAVDQNIFKLQVFSRDHFYQSIVIIVTLHTVSVGGMVLFWAKLHTSRESSKSKQIQYMQTQLQFTIT